MEPSSHMHLVKTLTILPLGKTLTFICQVSMSILIFLFLQVRLPTIRMRAGSS